MSEKWHYITTARGVEELYNLENDPMEWTNLANNNTHEIALVKKSLKAFVPTINSDVIKTDKGGGSEKDKKANTKKELDPTLKSKRILKDLK